VRITKALKYGLLAAVILIFVIIFSAIISRLWQSQSKTADFGGFERRVLLLEREVINDRLNELSADIAYIAYTYSSYETYIVKNTKLKYNWKVYLSGNELINNVRLIDINGNEIIKVIKAGGSAVHISQARELKNISDSNLFKKAIKLLPNQLYISKLYLEKENNSIDAAYKPVISIAAAVYNGAGITEGIVVLNCDANEVFKDLFSLSQVSFGELYLVNSTGHWILRSRSSDLHWGQIYSCEDADKADFEEVFSRVWEAISADDHISEGRITTKSGMFAYMSSPPYGIMKTDNGKTLFSEDGPMTLVTYIPNDFANGMMFSRDFASLIEYVFGNMRLFHVISLIFLVLIILLILMAVVDRKKRREYQFDALTHAYNRGEGYKRLKKTYDRYRIFKRNRRMCICFIDLNGLKKVNDSHGHSTGDKLIALVVQIIRQNIRAADFIIRLGGDEFIIVFAGLNAVQAELVWRRIEESFNNAAKNKDDFIGIPISVSHGIIDFSFEKGESIDKVIDRADEIMYAEKKKIHET
jgi:diguanylate cyclase (GGDEF)-like protein